MGTEKELDYEHLQFLVHSYNFSDGILSFYSNQNLSHNIIQHYIQKKDYKNLLQACREHGKNDQNVWVEVLYHLAEAEGNQSEKTEDEKYDLLESLLNDPNNLLPPLQVIQILSKNSNATLKNVKRYLIKNLEEEKRIIEEDTKSLNEMENSLKKMKEELYDLQTKVKLFQSNNCAECTLGLKVPTVHFMCGHSYHKHCLNVVVENGQEKYVCKECMEKNVTMIETIKTFESNMLDQNSEQFFSLLNMEPQTKGFETVSEYFGKGIFKRLEEKNRMKYELEKNSEFLETKEKPQLKNDSLMIEKKKLLEY